jgi:hypothetical protein
MTSVIRPLPNMESTRSIDYLAARARSPDPGSTSCSAERTNPWPTKEATKTQRLLTPHPRVPKCAKQVPLP